MALITPDVVYPAVVAGHRNGELPASILISTPGINGGPTVRLVLTAARCWRAMAGTALGDGMVLQATSIGDSYRWLALQVSTFTSRYQVEPTGNGYKLWDSDGNGTRERWYKMDGVASAAVPGTSHHGWGITVDVANAAGARLRWLELNAPRFGWAWELVPEEPWHLNNFTGDAIPAAVLAYEQGFLMALTEEQQADLYRRIGNIDSVAYYGLTLAQDELPAGSMRFGFGVGTPNAQPVPFGLMRLLHQMAANGGMSDAELEALKAELVEAVTGAVPSAEEVADATANELHARTAE